MSKMIELVRMAVTGDAHGFKAAFENSMAERVNGLVEKQFTKMNESVGSVSEEENEELEESAEQVDEVSKGRLSDYIDNASERKNQVGKYEKRNTGLQNAAKKLTGYARVNAKEEVEQVDEISKERVGQYALKALASRQKHTDASNKANSERAKATHNMNKVKFKGPDRDYGETDDAHKGRVDTLAKRAAKAGAVHDAENKKAQNRNTGLYRAGKILAKD